MVAWIPLAISAASAIYSAQQQRKAADSAAPANIPGFSEALQSYLRSQATAQRYLDASVNPENPMFRGLREMFRDVHEGGARQGLREQEIQRNRLSARGIPFHRIGNLERRDESVAKAWAEMFRTAALESKLQAQTSLANAARTSGGLASGLGGLVGIGGQAQGVSSQLGAQSGQNIAGAATTFADLLRTSGVLSGASTAQAPPAFGSATYNDWGAAF